MKKDDIVIVEQTFKAPTRVVWNALTELDQVKQWFFGNIPSFEPRVGFKTMFIVENEGRVFPHLWEITELEPLKKITWNWKYEGYTGNAFVTFEISEENGHTKLKLTNKVAESFPDHIPEFTIESCRAGWNFFIKKNLKAYLEK